MGWLSNIGSFIEGGVSNVEQTFKTIAANTLSSIGITNSFVAANTSTFTSPIPGAALLAEHPFASAALGGTVAAAFNPVTAPILASAASTVGKGIVSGYQELGLVGKVVAPAAAVFGTSLVVSSASVRKNLITAPTSLAQFGSNIGKAIDNPTAANLTNIITSNPKLSAAAGAAAAIAIGGAIATAGNLYTNYTNTQAVKANTAATLLSSAGGSPSTIPTGTLVHALPIGNTVVSPATAKTPVAAVAPVKKVTKKKKKKSKKKTKKKKKSKRKAKSIKRRKKRR